MSPAVPGIRLARTGPVATLWLDRPAKRNALTIAMWRGLPGLVDDAARDPAVRVLLLRGAGGTFSAGADLADLPSLLGGETAGDAGRGQAGGGPTGAEAAAQALAGHPKPTIAVIEGYCIGGGCSLAVACDLRLAADTARFAIPAGRLGVRYPAAATQRLARLVGPSAALHLLYSAEQIDAQRALRIGLIDELIAAQTLDARAAELAGAIAANSQASLAAAKRSVAAMHPPRTGAPT